MLNYIVISALGQDRPGIVKEVSKTILDCGGNITESRMSVLGDEFALMVMVTGADQTIAAVEEALNSLKKKLDLTIISKKTSKRTAQQAKIPYKIEIISMDHPGIVHNVTDYLSAKHINVEELSTNSYSAAHTGTPMFSLDINITIPDNINVSNFKKEFTAFCDELNLDVSLKPCK